MAARRSKIPPRQPVLTAEHRRLTQPFSGHVHPWRKWGPYVAERSWATVREDYSANGDVWNFFPHDLARSKAYRWGEDGIAAICDRYQLLVFALALWNGCDPILKERMFGLTSPEGNHGEDVKEYWFYLDNTPTHSYMRMLYKYPQRAFPYLELLQRNRGGSGPEFELLDTGIFDDDRYFDVFVEYAKADPEDVCIRIQVVNRGPETAEIHILPHLWYRNTWAWTTPHTTKPSIVRGPNQQDELVLLADNSAVEPSSNLQFPYSLGNYTLSAPSGGEILFTDNESNEDRCGVRSRDQRLFVKDAFHRYVVNGEPCVKRDQGTKACIRYQANLEPGQDFTLRARLSARAHSQPLNNVNEVIRLRRQEADEFYETVHPPKATDQDKLIQRQALAGMLWNKQVYLFDVERWLEGDDPACPPPSSRKNGRNKHWRHLNSMRIMSVPDKWEFPWFASWDLAFQCVTLSLVDPEFAKENLWLLLFEQFQHPNGQIPAYEWEFSDMNPPVHAWACWRVYELEKQKTGHADAAFLEKCLHKLLINFAWWVNRVDSQGNNVFEGGFLGLDNITVIDRGEKPNGAILEQSDATGWMGFFCLYLMRIALELSRQNRVYELLATKFFEHFVYIGAAMKNMGGRSYQLWDDEDAFFYDVLRFPNGDFQKLRLRSLVGLIPLFAIETLTERELRAYPEFLGSVEWFINNRRDLVGHACSVVRSGSEIHYVLSIADPNQLQSLLRRIHDPEEFLSPYGLRSLSKFHKDHPFRLGNRCVCYEPAESEEKIKGGNSNWRGPVWFPTSYLLINSLLRFSTALGPAFPFDPGNGAAANSCNPAYVAEDLANRMISIFTRDISGRRPCFGSSKKFQDDLHWRDYLLFFEYYHGDTGAGLGASHQTGWTGLVANLIDEWRR